MRQNFYAMRTLPNILQLLKVFRLLDNYTLVTSFNTSCFGHRRPSMYTWRTAMCISDFRRRFGSVSRNIDCSQAELQLIITLLILL
jgi:hypothetical protein